MKNDRVPENSQHQLSIFATLTLVALLIVAFLLEFNVSTKLSALMHRSDRLSVLQSEIQSLLRVNRALDVPPNNIFLSHNADLERQRLSESKRLADSLLLHLHELVDIAALTHTNDRPEFLAVFSDSALLAIRLRLETLAMHADSTLSHYGTRHFEQATRSMALADHSASVLASELDEIEISIESTIRAVLNDVSALSKKHDSHQYALAFLLFFLALFVVVVGHRVNNTLLEKNLESAEQYRELENRQELIDFQRMKFETILGSISDAVIVTDELKFITYTNPAADTLLGASIGSLYGRQLTDVIDLEAQDPAELASIHSVHNLDGTRIVYLKRQDCGRIAVEYSLAIIDDSSQSTVMVLRDASNRLKFEESLIKSERKMREFLETLPVGAVLFEGNQVTINRHVEAITGSTRDQVSTKDDWFNRIFAYDPRSAREHYDQHRTTDSSQMAEVPFQHSNGSVRFAAFNGYRLGETEVWVMRDVTEERKRDEMIERLSIVAEQAGAAVSILDADGVITWVNASYIRMTGLEKKQAIGMPVKDRQYGPDTSIKTLNRINDAIRNQTYFEGELLGYHVSGHTYWKWLSINPVIVDGACNGFVCIAHDITLRKEQEQFLRLVQLSVDNSTHPVLWLGEDGSIRYANAAASNLTRLTHEELLITNIDQIATGMDFLMWSSVCEVVQKYGSQTFETNLRIMNEPETLVEFQFHGITATNEKLIIAHLNDVSLRRKYESQILQNEFKMRQFIEHLPAGALLIEKDRISINRHVEEITGYSRYQLQTLDDWFAALYGSDAAKIRSIYESDKAKNFTTSSEVPFIHSDGSQRLARFQGYRTEEAEVWLMRDITEDHRRDEHMKRLSVAVEQSGNIIVITDPQGIITFVNRRFCECTGYTSDEIVGNRMNMLKSGLTDQSSYDELWGTITTGKIWSGHIQNRRKDGSIYWERETITPIIEADGEISSFLAIKEDITAELERDKKLQQTDKLSAVGTLAAGIAHEFKNYLGGIVGNASYALDELFVSDELSDAERKEQLILARDTLVAIVDMCEGANEVAMSLLTYSRSRTDELEGQKLDDIIQRTAKFVEKEMKQNNIELIVTLEETSEVLVIPGKIHQLLLNLLINASHALEDGGMISVQLRQRGDKVELAVSDSGKGIAPEHLSRIFDPFYSTKGVWGKDQVVGTGLGLTVCRNIAEEHQGQLTVSSVVGKGTVFVLTLPAFVPKPLFETDALPISDLKLVLFSSNEVVIRRYDEEGKRLGMMLAIADSISALDESLLAKANSLILDGNFPAKIELMQLIGRCERLNCPILIVNAGAREAGITEAIKTAAVSFSSLPPLLELIAHVERAPEPNLLS